MSDGHRLAQLMRQAGRPPENETVDIVGGTVTSISPLKVRVENRELTQSFLIVGAMCKETRIRVDDKDILIFPALKVGDKVKMLKVCKGQKYYIIERC